MPYNPKITKDNSPSVDQKIIQEFQEIKKMLDEIEKNYVSIKTSSKGLGQGDVNRFRILTEWLVNTTETEVVFRLGGKLKKISITDL